MKFLLTFVLLLGSVAAQAADCISKEEMQEIAGHFTQFRSMANKEYCYDGSHTSHLLAGIMFMRKTQFNLPMQPSKDELFSGRFASSWYDYFIGRIDEFEIDKGCPKGVGAYVYGFGGKTMYVCTMLLSDNFTALDRASVFMHEARHIDGYPHMTCRSGPRARLQGACDDAISDGGSYAVTVETYAQLSRYAIGIHPALKAYARSAAVIYADEAFDTPVRVERSQQFLVMTNDKRFHKVSTSGAVEDLGLSPALGRVVMRGQHMILFPEDKTLTARYVFARNEGEIAQQAGDLAVEYNELSPEQRANLVDTHIATQWTASVFQDKVRFACDPRSARTEEVSLKGERPVGLLYMNGYDRAARSVQMMMESGRVMELGCNGSSAQLDFSRATLDQKYKAIYKMGDLTLGLTQDGYLREIVGSSSRPFSIGALDGQVFEIVPNQSIAFFNEK